MLLGAKSQSFPDRKWHVGLHTGPVGGRSNEYVHKLALIRESHEQPPRLKTLVTVEAACWHGAELGVDATARSCPQRRRKTKSTSLPMARLSVNTSSPDVGALCVMGASRWYGCGSQRAGRTSSCRTGTADEPTQLAGESAPPPSLPQSLRAGWRNSPAQPSRSTANLRSTTPKVLANKILIGRRPGGQK